MNQDEILIQNRNRVDSAIQSFLLDTREIVCELVKPLADHGRFSLENIRSESRGNLSSVEDIAGTGDPTALLAVLMECLSDRSGPALLEIAGVNFQLVDRVRRIRNAHAHGGADYGDFNYVRDAVNAVNDLKFGLQGAGPRPSTPVATTPRPSTPLPTRPRSATPRVEIYRYPTMPLPSTPRVEDNPGLKASESAAAAAEEKPVNALTLRRQAEARIRRVEGVLRPKRTQAFFDAYSRDDIQVALRLVQEGIDTTTVNSDGLAPLHLASSGNNLTGLVLDLISAGADIHVQDNHGNTPLHLATSLGRVTTVTTLIGVSGGDKLVDARNSQGQTPLHLAAANGQTYIIDFLLRARSDLNAQDNSGNTPLHLAILNKSEQAKAALIQAGADLSVSNNAGRTPPQLAGYVRLTTIGRWVLFSGLVCLTAIAAAVLLFMTLGGAVLETAVLNNELWKVKALTAVGVDVNTPSDDSYGFTPLHIAARLDQPEVAGALISAGAEVNSITSIDGTPLHEAAFYGSVLTGKELVVAGADITARTEDGYTPLAVAAINKQVGTGKQLIEAGTDYNAGGGRSGRAPLHIAAGNGDISFVRMLADAGADVNAGDLRGLTPLHYAIWRPQMGIGYFKGERNIESGTEMVELLVNLGADVGARSNIGSAPLHLAAREGDTEIINALIRAGADVNDRNDEGRTALVYAEEANQAAAAAIIVESGGTR